MRRGRNVEMKTSSATAWTVRNTAGKLFHTLLAAAAKVLSPKQLEDRWIVSVLVSAERSSLARASVVGDKLTVIGKVSRGMTRQVLVDERHYLEHHALSDRQPVQLTKHWWKMVGSLSARYQPGSRILYGLHAAKQFVMPKTAWQWFSLGGIVRQTPDHRPQLSQLVVATAGNWCDMLAQRQPAVDNDAKVMRCLLDLDAWRQDEYVDYVKSG